MCGIVGVLSVADSGVSPRKSSIFFRELLLLSQSRGKDASGVATIQKDSISVIKAPFSVTELLNEADVQKLTTPNLQTHSFIAFGHSRMETDGSFLIPENNQPVVKDGCVLIHNGIVVNHELLWNEEPELKKEFSVDSEIINSLLVKYSVPALRRLQGSFSIAAAFDRNNSLLLATNTGSLYFLKAKRLGIFAFASEKTYLLRALEKTGILPIKEFDIEQLKPGTGLWVDYSNLQTSLFQWQDKSLEVNPPQNNHIKKISTASLASKTIRKSKSYPFKETETHILKHFAYCNEKIGSLRRCTKCILPETMPYITFDSNGVCNYCKKHQPRETRGIEALHAAIEPYRNKKGPNCIVCLSGGRDSSYALHYVKKELGLKPVAYSYDWGMLTDLGRRNQARMTGALGVEHLLVSADIKTKRSNIRKNILAWLKKPSLGMIPLFMAGDKHYFYHVDRLKKELELELVIYADNALEKTDFKYGFAGVELSPDVGKAYDIGKYNSFKLLSYYAGQYLSNPSYLNSSLVDTFTAYLSSYFVPKDYLYLYRYLLWEENEITNTLTHSYDWELAPDSKFSWRIGDGTAGFYNYIYYTAAGFTEHDTFRSNQIREGVIARNEGLKLAAEGNIPRLESIEWYLKTLDLDPATTFQKIHQIPKLYELEEHHSQSNSLKNLFPKPMIE